MVLAFSGIKRNGKKRIKSGKIRCIESKTRVGHLGGDLEYLM